MVRLTRFDGSELLVNAELIEMVEANPDTVVTLTTGRRLLVSESVEEVVDRVKDYRRSLVWREGDV